MSDLNICYLTASEALRRFKDRTLSPVELLQAYLARAEETKDTVNGFTALYAEEALASAVTAARGIGPQRLEGTRLQH